MLARDQIPLAWPVTSRHDTCFYYVQAATHAVYAQVQRLLAANSNANVSL